MEDEYRLAAGLPKLLYVKSPAPDRQVQLTEMLNRVKADDDISYQRFSTPAQLRQLVETDLALLLSERFEMTVSARPHAGRRHDAAERRSAPSASCRCLPHALVGREGTVAALGDLLVRDGARLITLTGPGGVGKTRLALALAARTGPSFDDGARFIELASVRTAEQVASAISAGLGLAPSGGKPAEAVKAYLRSRKLLLVLDNFEQVDRRRAARGRPAERVSRAGCGGHQPDGAQPPRRARVRGSTLSVPDQTTPLNVADLEGFDSVRLFVERARSATAAFDLTIDNAPAVAEICRRLDGLPLAIELAAAKVRMFSPQALLARLDHRLAVLTGGARDLPERQRTLRNTLDWSFELLAPADQTTLARLGVFVGGFDLPAAGSVSGLDRDDPGATVEVEEALISLTESSLVRHEERNGETRFQMLETIREYALERLRSSEDWEPAHQSHATNIRGGLATSKPVVCSAG